MFRYLIGSPIIIIIIILTIIINKNLCQENAGTSVSPSLVECYNNSLLVIRNYRLPSTINVFIELIRKIEDGSTMTNARELSYQIIQRFRQDGIMKTDKRIDMMYALPYSPKRLETFKNRVQLKKLTPGNSINFNNNSLNSLEKCSLHSFISSTIELNERGDEDIVCNKISRYTSRIAKRSTETFSEIEKISSISSMVHSVCPIESGVLYTQWGAIKGSLIISGITSGFQKMLIPTKNHATVDNRYASTIAGELSEAALYQSTDTIKIGAKGGWNSTILPKYYFLQVNELLHVTDAEIRGGLDGLILSLNIDNWKSKFSNIKISQIIDLYYSSRGVFNNTIRACNRYNLANSLLTTDKIKEEITNFNHLLNEEAEINITPYVDSFPKLAENTFNAFKSYLSSLNSDLQCLTDNILVQRVATDILIFLDNAWSYSIIQPFLSQIIDNIDINKFESKLTMFNGLNLDSIVNTTHSILDFYEKYNLSQHQIYPSGFDYNKVFYAIEQNFKNKLNNESDLNGQSMIVLLLPHNTPNNNEKDFSTDKRNIFKSYYPDVKILVVGNGNNDAYSDIVMNTKSDVFTLNDNYDEINMKTVAKNVINRIKEIPRSIVNPKCGNEFSTSDINTFTLTQFVEPHGINFHKLSPHYFYAGGDDNRRLKINGFNYGTLSVCKSRTIINPKDNSSDITCQLFNSNEIIYDLKDACDGNTVLDCAPFYFSIEGKSSQIRCTEPMCRFPDNIKYTITLENVGCTGDSVRLIPSFTFLFVILYFYHIFI